MVQAPPHIEPTPAVTEMGVKTKTQLLAERQVLRQLITSVIAASADKDLQPQGADYTLGVCRHFALLFAAGASAPLPSVPAGTETSRTARMSSLKELDPHIFLDALVEVWPSLKLPILFSCSIITKFVMGKGYLILLVVCIVSWVVKGELLLEET